MVVGINEVFDNVVKYLKKNYPKVESVTMPYCSLTEDITTKEKYYRAQVRFKISEQESVDKTAILKANPETGKVYWFQEGFGWAYWV